MTIKLIFKFSRQGSVIVDIRLKFLNKSNNAVELLKTAVASGKVSSLVVDRKSFEVLEEICKF